MIFFGHAEEAAKTNHRKHDGIGLLVENDVLNGTDLGPAGVLYIRSDYFLRSNCRCVARTCCHIKSPVQARHPTYTLRRRSGSRQPRNQQSASSYASIATGSVSG